MCAARAFWAVHAERKEKRARQVEQRVVEEKAGRGEWMMLRQDREASGNKMLASDPTATCSLLSLLNKLADKFYVRGRVWISDKS